MSNKIPNTKPKPTAQELEAASEIGRLALIEVLNLSFEEREHEAFEIWADLSPYVTTAFTAQAIGCLTGVLEELANQAGCTPREVAEGLLGPLAPGAIDYEAMAR